MKIVISLIFSLAFIGSDAVSQGMEYYEPAPSGEAFGYGSPRPHAGESSTSYAIRLDDLMDANDAATSFAQGQTIAEGYMAGREIARKRQESEEPYPYSGIEISAANQTGSGEALVEDRESNCEGWYLLEPIRKPTCYFH